MGGGRYVWSIRSRGASLSPIFEEREKKKMPPKKGGKAAGKGKGKGGGKGGGKKGGPTIIDGVRSVLHKIIWCWEAAKVFPGASQRDVSGPAGRARAQAARGAAEGEGRAELLPAGEGSDRHVLGGDSERTGGDES